MDKCFLGGGLVSKGRWLLGGEKMFWDKRQLNAKTGILDGQHYINDDSINDIKCWTKWHCFHFRKILTAQVNMN
jgi:hypothetical protein